MRNLSPSPALGKNFYLSQAQAADIQRWMRKGQNSYWEGDMSESCTGFRLPEVGKKICKWAVVPCRTVQTTKALKVSWYILVMAP